METSKYENSPSNSYILKLPPDVIIYISKWLDIKSACRLLQTCSFMNNLWKNSTFFKQLCLRDFQYYIPQHEQTALDWRTTYKTLCTLKIVITPTNNRSRKLPVVLDCSQFNNEVIQNVCGGRGFSAVLTSNGNVFTFSQFNENECGYGNAYKYGRPGNFFPPGKLENLPPMKSLALATGDGYHAAALSREGDLYIWGRNDHFQLGSQRNESEKAIPRLLAFPNNAKISKFALGWNHSVAISTESEVFIWGRGSLQSSGMPQLGLGTTSDQRYPVFLPFFSTIPIVDVAAGDCHTLFLTKDGQVYGLGRNDHKELGLNDKIDRTTPTLITCIQNEFVVQISTGEMLSAVLTKEGKIYYWGYVYNSKKSLYALVDPTQYKKNKRFTKVACSQCMVFGIEKTKNECCGLVGVYDIGPGYSHICLLCSAISIPSSPICPKFNPKLTEEDISF